MKKKDFQNIFSKTKKSDKAQQVNIQVDLHVNKPDSKNINNSDDSTIIDVNAEEIKSIGSEESIDSKEKMLNFESVNSDDVKMDFSNANNIVINQGVTYDTDTDSKVDEEFHEVTSEDLDEAIKNFNKSNKGNKKKYNK